MKSTRVRRAIAVAGAVVDRGLARDRHGGDREPVERHGHLGDHRGRGRWTTGWASTPTRARTPSWPSSRSGRIPRRVGTATPARRSSRCSPGTFTVYHDNCHAMTYEAGDAFVELPSSIHVGRNETDGTVQLGVVFFGVPIGGSPRIDQPQPDGCDVT